MPSEDGREKDGEEDDEDEEEEEEKSVTPPNPVRKKAAANPVQKKASQKPDSTPSAVKKCDHLSCESKLKPANHYGNDTGGDNKRKRKQWVGKVGRCDPHEEFGFGSVKKRRASPVKHTEEEEEWEEDEVSNLSSQYNINES